MVSKDYAGHQSGKGGSRQAGRPLGGMYFVAETPVHKADY